MFVLALGFAITLIVLSQYGIPVREQKGNTLAVLSLRLNALSLEGQARLWKEVFVELGLDVDVSTRGTRIIFEGQDFLKAKVVKSQIEAMLPSDPDDDSVVANIHSLLEIWAYD